nr:hypothetical protein [Streptomyces sp. NEAU-YJ-81]
MYSDQETHDPTGDAETTRRAARIDHVGPLTIIEGTVSAWWSRSCPVAGQQAGLAVVVGR